MARGPKKVKEYESIKVVKYFAKGEGMKEFEIKTTLTYTPFDGGKGWIVKIRSL